MELLKWRRSLRTCAVGIGIVLFAGAIAFAGALYGGGFFGRGWKVTYVGSNDPGILGVYNNGNGMGIACRADNNDALWCDGTAEFSGRITSTVAEGTAPLSVSSTTTCTNLNADMVDGLSAAQFAKCAYVQVPANPSWTGYLDIPHYRAFMVVVANLWGPPQQVGFITAAENDGWVRWQGFDGAGNHIMGTGSVTSSTTIMTVTSGGGTITLRMPGDGTYRLKITTTGADGHVFLTAGLF